ncbi:MAG: glutathione S-transferase family protein [Polyangiaceae bacterium]
MAKVTLVGLPYSPWTHKARWALDHHGIGYRFEDYMPIVGAPMLRLRSGNYSKKLSVPVLITPHGSLAGGMAIAHHADNIGDGTKLVDGREKAVEDWNATSDAALEAARGLVIRAMGEHPLAQEESVPLPLPAALKRPLARFGGRMVARKWGVNKGDSSEMEGRLTAVLDRLRRALADGGDRAKKDGYLLGGAFSFADIAMASTLQTIKPVDDRFIRLGPGLREAWTRPALVARYEDLLAWRDRIFEKHRAPR